MSKDTTKSEQTGPDKENLELLKSLVKAAVEARASDIHLEPFEGGEGRIRFRIDGALAEQSIKLGAPFARLVDVIKSIGTLDVEQRSLPQDARIMMQQDEDGIDIDVDIRVSVVPTIHGERVTMRILRREAAVLGLDQFGLLEDDLAKIRELCRLPAGIVIVTGPQGSGKTTTLYSMLLETNRPEVLIMTVEDPVEYSFQGMGQIQINPSIGLTFERAIRHVLRQDPDVIMVGEIRNLEAMGLSIQCAMTGHLVLTTLHTNTAVGAIRRILDMGIDPFMVNAGLSAAIGQRLVRKLCPKCRKPAKPPMHAMPPEAIEFTAKMGDVELFAADPKGCNHCRGQGYKGRTSINEILVMNDRIRQLISEGADMAAVQKAACESGMKTMLQNGLEKAARGITSIEEVIRVAPHGLN